MSTALISENDTDTAIVDQNDVPLPSYAQAVQDRASGPTPLEEDPILIVEPGKIQITGKSWLGWVVQRATVTDHHNLRRSTTDDQDLQCF